MDQVPEATGQGGEQEHSVVLPLQHEVLQLFGDPAHELILVGREENAIHAAQRQGGSGWEAARPGRAAVPGAAPAPAPGIGRAHV